MAQIFPRWSNEAPRYVLLALLVGLGTLIFAVYYWGSPWNTDVGYRPVQPVPYSHKLHAGDLGMDCRYCHNYVEQGPHAGVPPTQTCMNCHSQVRKDSPKLAVVRESWEKGTPIPWVRVHKSPDYVYFDHSAHMGFGVGENRAAIGCESCHGRVDTFDEAGVMQVAPLSMSWCIDCHNDPAPKIRPVSEIAKMGWVATPAWRDRAAKIASTLQPPGSVTQAHMILADGTPVTTATAGCSGCHR